MILTHSGNVSEVPVTPARNACITGQTVNVTGGWVMS